MKAYALFQEYIWLVNTIHRFGRLTLEEINQRWLDTELSEGVPIARSTFNRHRDAILDMFGIIIECDKKDGFRYYIFNEEVLDEEAVSMLPAEYINDEDTGDSYARFTEGGSGLHTIVMEAAIEVNADCIVTLSHASLDAENGYRGVLHAVGFGCGAHPGKVDMLTTGQPVVDADKCIGCGKCTGVCEHGGTRIDPETGKAFIFKLRCAGCSRCMRVCPVDAIHPDYNATDERVRMKIAEAAKSVCDHRACLHLALAGDALLAADDPTALDAGCADLLGADEALRISIDHAAEMGLGTKDYTCERI